MNIKQIIKDALILTAITVVAGFLLGLVYEITKEPIEAAELAAQQAAYQEVFAEASTFEEYADYDADEAAQLMTDNGYEDTVSIDGVMEAYDESGTLLGYVLNVTDGEGYGGDICFSLGLSLDGTMNGISFTTLDETAGLGQKAKEETFSSQFNGINVSSITLVKVTPTSEEEIQAISGATITSTAVTNGVNGALCYFTNVLGGGSGE